MINKIKNGTISEALAKQKLNPLNKIKKAEIKNKCLINGQKELLNLFNDLIEAIFNNNNIIVSEDNNNNNNNNNKNNNLIEHNYMDNNNNNNNK